MGSETNGEGDLVWQKSLGGSGDEKAFCIEQTAGGGFIVAGLSYSNDGDVTGNHGLSDCWIVKLNSVGNIAWEKSFGGSGDERAYSVQATADGKFIMGGWSDSNDGDVTGHHGSLNLADYWLVKLDVNGNLIWQKSLGGSSRDLEYGLQQISDGSFLVAGASYSTDGDVTGNHGVADAWIVKLNTDANLVWQKSLGGSSSDLAYSVQETADSGSIVASWSLSPNDGDVMGNHGGYDYWLTKLDADGNLQWQKSLGGSNDDRANFCEQTADGGFIVAGYSESDDGDMTGNHGGIDYGIIKLSGDQLKTFYADADADGYGDANVTLIACTPPPGYITMAGDCNDANSSIHSGATEICGNNVDDNCNGLTDENCAYAITTGSVSGSPFCPEAIVNVPFTSSGTFFSGNIYTAELSNKKGNFNVPTPIGTLNSTAGSGTISATIPSKPIAGTNYRIRVTSSNPAVTGTNNGSNLKLVACGLVMALSASGISTTAVSLNWTGVSCAVKYKVQYRKQGTSSWTTQYSSTNSNTITGLAAGTTYEYHVQTYCTQSGSSKSGFTPVQTFTTTLRLASVSASTEGTMNIHPNPAADQTVIHLTLAQTSHVYIDVYDLRGKEIETLLNDYLSQGDHSLELNTTHFSKGVYLVKIISDFGIENQKLIVQ